ncbi:nucleotidyltransferase family protein [Arenibacter certesii]|uniref:Molybdopterin-guanine dinucleotide biosynthesis protein MobA n=1 Tax=Arenibacter certesii TaxID=228955 RepID=A0A918MNS8_9FLAO|nr:nucleotidyltransferase family protein [Arenibacter certesii]GGW44277.1 molybdopterin-guanine dinucleotide biosynthesis protein MobA [Arenibacter certesii]
MKEIKFNIAVIIMAAGASSRMGTAKQLLPWGKSTLIENAIKNATDSDAKEVYVVLGARAEQLKNSIGLKEEAIIYNRDWQSGLGSSIAIATRFILEQTVKFDGILIMLADQPLIDATYLNQLITAFYEADENIITTKYDNGNGVPAIFGSSHYLELLQIKDDSGAKDIIRRHKNRLVSIDSKGKTADVDTYEEYLKMLEGSVDK